jgi:hypothetical protein
MSFPTPEYVPFNNLQISAASLILSTYLEICGDTKLNNHALTKAFVIFHLWPSLEFSLAGFSIVPSI